MRGAALIASFLLLLVALWGLWQHRFERVQELSAWQLGAPDKALPRGVSVNQDPLVLALLAEAKAAPVVCRMKMGGPVAYLHLNARSVAKILVAGAEPWLDGRCVIEWQPVDGHPVEMDPVSTLRNDQDTGIEEMVMRPAHPPAIPVLRLEDLGVSGTFELHDFKATPVRESVAWKIGRWVLVIASLIWIVALVRVLNPRVKPAAAVMAAVMGLVMWTNSVVPGPWKKILPLASPFAVSNLSAGPISVLEFPAAIAATPSVSAGKIPDNGDFTLRIRHQADTARPLLHILLLAGPILLIALAAGKRPAWVLGAILSVAIELAQVAYGFDFDWRDVLDLLCDAAGILLALLVHTWLRRRWPVRLNRSHLMSRRDN